MDEVTDLTATDLSARIAAGEIAAEAVMAACLDRIEAANPEVNAIVSLRPRDDLLAEARALGAGARRGLLHGLPVAVKDLVATKGLKTTWGSPLFADFIPSADDLVAARMRAAGAIFIGKTNTPEWGQGSHSFNPVHGTTRNPYDLTRSAGGSSGGAAAALAARMVPIADGSDMMGSLRNPAAFCNVYGFRPTWGLVPQDADGDSYLSTLSTDGPMARCPEDLLLLLRVLAGPSPAVPFCRTDHLPVTLAPANLAGLRIGWLGDWGGAYPLEPGIAELCEEALKTLEHLGARVEPVAPPLSAEAMWSSWTTLRAMLNAGAKRSLHDDPAKRAQTKPETLWEIEQGLSLSAAEVYEASVTRSRWHARAAQVFEAYDALILPAAQVWPFPADWRWPQSINGRAMDTYHRWMEIVVPASLIGLPCLAAPVGFGANGLPMGMQILGPQGADARLLAIGEAWHRATDWPVRRPPVLPSRQQVKRHGA
jgi:amidase